MPSFTSRAWALKGVNLGHIYRGVVPFLILQAIGVFFCTIFPDIVVWLPECHDGKITHRRNTMIPRIKNILYATDLSKNSAYAFRYAVNSAQKHDAQIHILHVIETIPPATEGIMHGVDLSRG